MIKLQIIGNLGKDAVVNNVNGKSVINFSVAHTEKYKDATGTPKERTTWVECAYWTDKTAIAPYLKRGTTVFTEGIPDVKTYTTQDGRTGATLSLRISNIQLVGNKPQDGGGTSNNYQAANTAPQQGYSANNSQAASSNITTESAVDDLPF